MILRRFSISLLAFAFVSHSDTPAPSERRACSVSISACNLTLSLVQRGVNYTGGIMKGAKFVARYLDFVNRNFVSPLTTMAPALISVVDFGSSRLDG
jgi:hypothetical protein